MLIPFGILSAAAGVEVAGSYELIATEILTTTESSITFSNLGDYSSTYKHLQIRWVTRSTATGANIAVYSRLNGDTGSNYSLHTLFGDGSGVASGNATNTTLVITGIQPTSTATANSFSAGVIDLLDPYSTTKNKTFRTLSGIAASDNRIDLHSGNWRNTASVTSWTVLPQSGNFAIGTRFSLYGIKG
jgi:hypothetical protein